MTEKTPRGQIRCGNCGSVGQWKARRETRPQAHARGGYHEKPPDNRTYLELECAVCGVYTYANPTRVEGRG